MAAEPQLPIFGRTNRQSQGRARNFLGGGGSSPIVRPVQNITRINQQKRPETLPTKRFGKATGVDAYNFLSNPKVSKAIRKSLTRLKDVMLQSFTVAKLLRVSLSNIFNQLKGFGKKAAGGLAGIGLVGLLGAIGYGLYKFFEPKIKEVIDKILEFKKKIEDFATNVREKVEGFVEGVKERFNDIKNTLFGWYNNVVSLVNKIPGVDIPLLRQDGMSNLGENYRDEEQRAIVAAERFRETGELTDDLKDEGPLGTSRGALPGVFDVFGTRDIPKPEQPKAKSTTPIMGSGSNASSKTTQSGSGNATAMARALITEKEGFKEMPYYDVNAFRAGYGSDTYTTESGEVKRVVQGQKVSRADADRDIDRRISTEFMPAAKRGVGAEVWETLPEQAKAALTSIAYNYGSLPGRVTEVARSTRGDLEAIAKAVESLKTDDKGINAARRQHEADMIRSSVQVQPAQPIGNQSSVARRSGNIAMINTQAPQASVPRQPSRVSSTPQSSESGPTIAFLNPSNPDAFSSLATKAELNIVAS
jgi:GH24 family phage-related lysozyme (muramidase)